MYKKNNNNMNVKMLVCCHKKDFMVSNDVYYPLHVGKYNHPDIELNIQSDNTGDNISFKNDNYCELTGMYWAWKNMKGVDVIGLCHYRRYFDFGDKHIFKNQVNHVNGSELNTKSLAIPPSLLSEVSNRVVVVPEKRILPISLRLAYCSIHSCEDLNVLEDVILKTQEQKYIDAYKNVMRYNNKISCYNMFVMKWDIFNDYCKWLFDLLFVYERYVNITSYSDYQKRIFGFISERLLNVYIEANKLQIIEKPILLVDNVKSKPLAGFIYRVHSFFNNLIFKFNKIVNGKSF